MKKEYKSPKFEQIIIDSPMLMLDVSRKGSDQSDVSDSDKSKQFWGPSLFDETYEEEF